LLKEDAMFWDDNIFGGAIARKMVFFSWHPLFWVNRVLLWYHMAVAFELGDIFFSDSLFQKQRLVQAFFA